MARSLEQCLPNVYLLQARVYDWCTYRQQSCKPLEYVYQSSNLGRSPVSITYILPRVSKKLFYKNLREYVSLEGRLILDTYIIVLAKRVNQCFGYLEPADVERKL